MKIKNILSGMVGLACLHAPVKAQIKLPSNIKISSEVGIAAPVKNDFSLYRGANIEMETGKNKISTFLGAALNANKKGTFIGSVSDNFSWKNHAFFSSWSRGMVMYSKRVKAVLFEISPVKFNFESKKFDIGFSPALSFSHDFKNKKSTTGINAVFESSYKISEKDKFSIEADYRFLGGKNIKNIKPAAPSKGFLYKFTYKRFF